VRGGRPVLRSAAITACLLLASGCSQSMKAPRLDRWDELEREQRQELAFEYPRGAARSTVNARVDRKSTLVRTWRPGEQERDPFLVMAVEHVEQTQSRAIGVVDVHEIVEGGVLSAVFGFDIFQDYVVYDERERVIVAFRKPFH
jgi:hypothetical protein